MPRLAAFCLFATALLPLPAAAAGGSVRIEVKDPKGAPVADAVASLVPLDAPPVLTPPAEPAVILQDNEEYQPFVTALVVGTRVRFPNQDKVQHHVYSFSKAKAFDIPLYRGEPKELVTFDQPGVVTLGCNIHDWMSAYVVVLATPYFKKTPAEGSVTLDGLPAGRYRLEVWHPRQPALTTREVTLEATSPSTKVISVSLGPDRRIRRAPESAGGAYK